VGKGCKTSSPKFPQNNQPFAANELPDETQGQVQGQQIGKSDGASLVMKIWEESGNQCNGFFQNIKKIDRTILEQSKTIEQASFDKYLVGVESELTNLFDFCRKQYVEAWKNYPTKNPNTSSPLFQKGQALGISTVKNIWNDFGQKCQKVSQVSDIVKKQVEQNKTQGKYEIEFINGYQNGVEQELADLRKRCGGDY
jgi:hypothetical protein